MSTLFLRRVVKVTLQRLHFQGFTEFAITATDVNGEEFKISLVGDHDSEEEGVARPPSTVPVVWLQTERADANGKWTLDTVESPPFEGER